MRGLQLSIHQKLIGLVAVMMTVDSEVGRGTTFTISLPLEDAHAPAGEPTAAMIGAGGIG